MKLCRTYLNTEFTSLSGYARELTSLALATLGGPELYVR